MKIEHIINETTTAGAVSSVAMPLGKTVKRTNETVKGLIPAEKVMKAKKKGPYANSLSESKNKVSEAELQEDDLIIIPGQGMKRKNGFIPQGKSRVDHEVEMAKSDLLAIFKNTKSVMNCIKDKTEDEGLEGWVQEKIIKASDYLNTIAEYLEGKRLKEMSGGVIAAGGVGESTVEEGDLHSDFGDVVQQVKREWEAKRARERQGMSPRTVSEPSREELEARLRELESEFDPAYQYSDDYSFWTKQNAIAREIASIKKKLGSQGVAEGVAETLPMDDAVKVLRQYGADHFKTTSNELHFYKNGRPFSVDLVMNSDSTRNVTLSSLNSAIRGLKGQGVAEGQELYPEVLYHGSTQEIKGPLNPRQAKDIGGHPGSNKNAIYATDDPNFAIAHGLAERGSDTGTFGWKKEPRLIFFGGKIRYGKDVYIHVLPTKDEQGRPLFTKGGADTEWYSVPGVEAITPIKVVTKPVDQYLHLLRKPTPEEQKIFQSKKAKAKKGVAEGTLTEKAKSTAQQKFFGMAHAMQKGKKIPGASKELKDVSKTMSKSDVKDFAKTKHKDLPSHVKKEK